MTWLVYTVHRTLFVKWLCLACETRACITS